MKRHTNRLSDLSVVMAAIALGTGASVATATEPCNDFGECKVLIEINSTDGDIGFHFLMDGDDLNSARIRDPDGVKVFEDMAKGPLREQKLTETFAESAEPLCWDPTTDEDPENDDEDFVTLEEFLELWTPGIYEFTGSGDGGEKSEGETELTFNLPAAPATVGFAGGLISWTAGNDLGKCATFGELSDLVSSEVLPEHPENITVQEWEVVLEPDVEDGDITGNLKFTVRVPVNSLSVTVPADYLLSLPDNTPVKIEVGAIGEDNNATFTEVGGFCVNEVDDGCEEG